MTQVPYAEDP